MATGDLKASVGDPSRRRYSSRSPDLGGDCAGIGHKSRPVADEKTGGRARENPTFASAPGRWSQFLGSGVSGIFNSLNGSLTDAFRYPIAISIYLAHGRLFRAISDFPTRGAASQYPGIRRSLHCHLGAGIWYFLPDAYGGARFPPRQVDAAPDAMAEPTGRPPRISAQRPDAF